MKYLPLSFNPGIVGKNFDATKLMLVLHYSDTRAPVPHEPEGYCEALKASQTGKIILETLSKSELTLDDVFITNYVKQIKPGDKAPNKVDYSLHKPFLEAQVRLFSPKKVVLFGAPVYRHFFNESSITPYSVKQYAGIPVLASEHPGYIWRQTDRQERMNIVADFLKQ